MQVHIVLPHDPTPRELAVAETLINVLRSGASPAALVVPPPPLPAPAPALATPQAPDPSVFQAAVEPPAASVNAQAPAHDSRGFPWDKRICSGNKTVNQDGSWKKRKSVGDTTVTQVEGELRASGRCAPIVPPAPPPAPIAPTAPPPSVPAADFAGLMKRFADGVREKKFGPMTANEMAQAVGVAGPIHINQNPALIPKANEYLAARETGVDHATALAMIG